MGIIVYSLLWVMQDLYLSSTEAAFKLLLCSTVQSLLAIIWRELNLEGPSFPIQGPLKNFIGVWGLNPKPLNP